MDKKGKSIYGDSTASL